MIQLLQMNLGAVALTTDCAASVHLFSTRTIFSYVHISWIEKMFSYNMNKQDFACKYSLFNNVSHIQRKQISDVSGFINLPSKTVAIFNN
jgi:hypothetical protein